jgi:hypothetical protein
MSNIEKLLTRKNDLQSSIRFLNQINEGEDIDYLTPSYPRPFCAF